jgi:mRNA-degrading endonuclease YafQ of YafQ-DinJ toxin-antitoxin module
MNTKYKLRVTGECKQNMKLCKRRGLPMNELWTVVGKLLNGEQLEEKYQAHILTGDRKGQIPEQARLPVAFGSVTSSPIGC